MYACFIETFGNGFQFCDVMVSKLKRSWWRSMFFC